ncbi:MAG: phosphoesterase [Gammaproteobacteria bacterium]|nr:MAG: phosphoesterase [Gammaproteobacteria bacterium]UTW44052.1 TraM recognition domain-containing protein [bacterium SCSIO 12844]
MRKRKTFRGLSKAQESKPDFSVRDTRPLLERFSDFILHRMWGSVAIIALALLMLIPMVSMFADVIFIIIILLFWYAYWDMPSLPFKLPLGTRFKDKNNPVPGSSDPGEASGLYFFGNEFNTDHQIWFNNSDMRTHCLIFGSTGSGKTEALISISYNALSQGSGFIYVDGKGDNSLYAKVFSMTRSLGREDDLLVVNYMTGAADIIGPQKKAISNTLNPFAIGSSSMLAQLVTSMMGSSGQGGSSDGDMWKGRAISFVEALMRVLVYLRDENLLLLDASLIRKYFVLDVVENLIDGNAIDQYDNTVKIPPLPHSVTDPMNNYLATLPGYQRKNKGKQSDKTFEQHGYITMQLTRIFGSLADVYSHIMRTNLAEVDFNDVVLNRRILVVLLPALEKSPDELANLGRLIIASLKAMLATGLGSHIQGDYRDVIESKPTNSDTPYLCVLDEYGYYAVEGFAVVPAQARSLGFSVIFAGQDLPAFQKASKEEAASIGANTNIKICMKLEDPTETWEFFQKGAGEAFVSVAKSFNMGNEGNAMGYRDTKEATIEKRARIDLMDLKDQREGEMHVFFKSQIIRGRFFYANPPKTRELRLNQFLKIEPPSDEAARSLVTLYNKGIHPNDSISYETIQLSDNLQSIVNAAKELGKNSENFAQKCIQLLQSNASESDNTQPQTSTIAKNKAQTIMDENALDLSKTLMFMQIPLSERLDSSYHDIDVSNFDDVLVSETVAKHIAYKFAVCAGESISQSQAIFQKVAEHIIDKTTVKYLLRDPDHKLSDVIQATKNAFKGEG